MAGGVAAPRPPAAVRRVLERLWSAGFGAYLVGGSLRDALLDRSPLDWDVATSAPPERVRELFPGSVYENRFGTVLVRREAPRCEVTTFRREHRYADHRRPEHVEFTADLVEDLARRDFTVNAIAWGAEGAGAEGAGAEGAGAEGAAAGPRRAGEVGRPSLRDPFRGRVDLAAGIIRAVGDPAERFDEDALRLLRAVRFAATLGFTVEPRTLEAVRHHAALAAHLSGERVSEELRRILAASRPSVALRLMAETGLLEVCLPELAAQQGVPQAKVPGHDLWEHTLATVDASPPGRATVRLAALLHDVGKPVTLTDDGFPGHEREGARIAERMLHRLAISRREADRAIHLVRHHMFDYRPSWSDAAVRRFIRRIGADAVDDLLELRAADNAGSGLPAEAGRLAELRERAAAELAAGAPLGLADLAVDGDDLQHDLGLAPGPEIGRLLRELLELVTTDPASNTAERLLVEARRLQATRPHGAGGGRPATNGGAP